MKFRNILSLFAVSALLISCNTSGGTSSAANKEITLTKEEEEIANKNPNIIAQLLVKKAIQKEMANDPFTADEKKQIDLAKEEIEINAFLNKHSQEVARKNTLVTDEEVLKVYEDNKDKFGTDINPETALPQLKQLIYNQKFNAVLNEARINLVNQFVEKHKLNDILKKYVPESVYEDNKDKFGTDINPETALPQLKQLIYNQKFNAVLNEARINLVNQFVEKHKLNDILKKYVPESEIKKEDIPANNTTVTPPQVPTTSSETTAPASATDTKTEATTDAKPADNTEANTDEKATDAKK